MDVLSEGATFVRYSFESKPSGQNVYEFERHLDWRSDRLYALAKPVTSWACFEVFEVTKSVMIACATSATGANTLLRYLPDMTQRSSWGVETRQQRDEQGNSLMHVLALAYSVLDFHCKPPIVHPHGNTLANFLRQAVRAGADSHAVSGGDVEVTPLVMASLGTVLKVSSIECSAQSLQHWVGTLLAEGIDIEEYGRVESEAWLRNKPVHKLCRQQGYGFTDSRQSQDWNFFLEQPGYHYAGLSWDLVEQPEKQISGAWKDEDDDDYEDDDEGDDDDVAACEDEYFQAMATSKWLKKPHARNENNRKQWTTFQEVPN